MNPITLLTFNTSVCCYNPMAITELYTAADLAWQRRGHRQWIPVQRHQLLSVGMCSRRQQGCPAEEMATVRPAVTSQIMNISQYMPNCLMRCFNHINTWHYCYTKNINSTDAHGLKICTYVIIQDNMQKTPYYYYAPHVGHRISGFIMLYLYVSPERLLFLIHATLCISYCCIMPFYFLCTNSTLF